MSIDNHFVVRGNRDPLYSSVLVDLDAGPVTITLPDAGSRFMSMQIIDEDHYVPAVRVRRGTLHLHAPARKTSRRSTCCRMRSRPAAESGLVRRAQLGRGESDQSGPGADSTRGHDPGYQGHVRRRGPGGSGAPRGGRSHGLGRQSRKDAMYVTVVPAKNDGKTIHRVTVKDVTVDAFWSISVYNAKGSSSRTRSTHTFNNVTGTKAADGSITVQFGGCDAKTPNCLPISPGWNYWVRLYRPRPEILNGKWTFPAAEPCGERRPTSRPHRRWPLSSSLRRSHRPLAKPLPRAQANLPGIS
jgi:uncharacterized protein DUF1214/uncharacterized protein DUF1254